MTIGLCTAIMGRMPDQLKLQDAHKNFLDHLKAKKRASATILAYGKDIDQLTSFLAQEANKVFAQEVTKEDLENFLGKLGKNGYTQKSVSRKINSIKTFFGFLSSENYITINPSLPITHPKYEVKPPRILSPLEYRALRDACRGDARISAIVEVLLQTGIRIGELANLRLDDVKDKSLFIRGFEGHPPREVFLNRAAKTALDNYLDIRPKAKTDHVFVTRNGKQLLIRNIRTAVDRYFKLAGIENAKVNDLRHTFVAHHLRAGVSLVAISKLVGHKRISTTERYFEFVKDRSEEKTNTLTEL